MAAKVTDLSVPSPPFPPPAVVDDDDDDEDDDDDPVTQLVSELGSLLAVVEGNLLP
jgi:hypothetical protein